MHLNLSRVASKIRRVNSGDTNCDYLRLATGAKKGFCSGCAAADDLRALINALTQWQAVHLTDRRASTAGGVHSNVHCASPRHPGGVCAAAGPRLPLPLLRRTAAALPQHLCEVNG